MHTIINRAFRTTVLSMLLALAGPACLLYPAQSAVAQLAMHPAVDPRLPANRFPTDLGNWGESLVQELLEARGYKVLAPKVGSNGADFIAYKPGANGELGEVIVGEVKTRSAAGDLGKPGMTRHGQQLEPTKVIADLERAAMHAEDPQTRTLCKKVLERYKANPASVRLERHVLTLDDARYTVYSGPTNTRVVGRPVANGSLDKVLERLEQSSDPRTAKVARDNLRFLRENRAMKAAIRPAPSTVRTIPHGSIQHRAALIARPASVAASAFTAGALTSATVAGFATYQWSQGQISDARLHEELLRAGGDGIAVTLTTGAVLLLAPAAPGVVAIAVGAATVVAADAAFDWAMERENEYAIAREIELIHGRGAADAMADPLAAPAALRNPLGEALSRTPSVHCDDADRAADHGPDRGTADSRGGPAVL